MSEVVLTVLWTVFGITAGIILVFAWWRLRSMIKVWRAPARELRSVQARLWRDPGDVSQLDLAAGPGGHDGAPRAPFTFLQEHVTGSQPCVSVRDARGQVWRVKWGNEVQAEALATRLAWAAGYFVETTYYVDNGYIAGVSGLQRAVGCVSEDGEFHTARFELDERGVIKHFDEHSWAWNSNPFVGSRELNGLKIVMMWLSNWDAKDVRDVARGSNTAIFEYRGDSGLREARYLITDWGGAFGRSGSIVRRGRWDSAAFAAETETFITSSDSDYIYFGYTGQRTADIAEGIRVTDARWLLQRLGGLREAQIESAVQASGGSPEEAAAFAHALRARLDMLAAISSQPSTISQNPVPTER